MRLQTRHFVLALSCAVGLSAVLSCGDGGKSSAPVAPPAAPTAAPTATPGIQASPAPAPTPYPMWVGSNSQGFVVRYDSQGNRTNFIDLKKELPTGGGVTALTFLDATTLAAFLEPGASGGERIVTIDTFTGAVKNQNWFVDTVNLNQVAVRSMVVPQALTLFIGKAATGGSAVERLIFNASDTVQRATKNGTAWIPVSTTPPCVTSTVRGVASLGSGKLLILSSGAAGSGATTLSVIQDLVGLATCATAWDYSGAGQPTGATDVPVQAVLMPDGAVYVLYTAPAPKIVKYQLNGTTLSAPQLVFSDSAVLGANPVAMCQFSATSVLVGNPSLGTLNEVRLSDGTWTGFTINEFFTDDVGSCATQKK